MTLSRRADLSHHLRPTQAVILAGGRGTRLRPFTDTRPKPMFEIHGKPFLEYLIELLREQGFERILLLLGYLPDVIQNYFKDGRRWGLRIDYCVSPVEDETSRRLKLALPLIDPYFLMLYCDNYWPLQMEKMWHRFASANVPAMVTVYSNKDSYTRDNVCVDFDGYIAVFDKSRTAPQLSGVDISYALMAKSVIEEFAQDHLSFELAAYPRLAERRQLLAYVTDHRYYSIGSYARLPLTEAFLARTPTIILDRDGVLNEKPPRAQYVRSWDEFTWIPESKQALGLLCKAGWRVIIVSNQAGIARGAMTEAQLHDIHNRMQRDVVEAGGHIEAIYYCPHNWDEGCECRKPKPGMLFRAQREYSLDLSRTYFVGDDERDAQAADAAGCRSLMVSANSSLMDITRSILGVTSGK
jgi:D-glycero-D-manno-heptose 1,7-bisphosphate phosphatase